MSEYTRKSLADHLDAYDEEIAFLQDSKREMLNDYREQLAAKGWGKARIKTEVDGLKVAMRRRRAVNRQGNDAVEEADAIADEIFAEITAIARAPRATRENIEEFPPVTAHEVTPQHSGEMSVEGVGQGEDCESLSHEAGVTGESRAPTPAERQDDVLVAEAGGTADAHYPSGVEGPVSHPSDPNSSPDAADTAGSSDDFEPPAFLRRDHYDAGPIPAWMDRRHELAGEA